MCRIALDILSSCDEKREYLNKCKTSWSEEHMEAEYLESEYVTAGCYKCCKMFEESYDVGDREDYERAVVKLRGQHGECPGRLLIDPYESVNPTERQRDAMAAIAEELEAIFIAFIAIELEL